MVSHPFDLPLVLVPPEIIELDGLAADSEEEAQVKKEEWPEYFLRLFDNDVSPLQQLLIRNSNYHRSLRTQIRPLGMPCGPPYWISSMYLRLTGRNAQGSYLSTRNGHCPGLSSQNPALPVKLNRLWGRIGSWRVRLSR